MGADPKLPLENLIGGSKKTITVEKKSLPKVLTSADLDYII